MIMETLTSLKITLDFLFSPETKFLYGAGGCFEVFVSSISKPSTWVKNTAFLPVINNVISSIIMIWIHCSVRSGRQGIHGGNVAPPGNKAVNEENKRHLVYREKQDYSTQRTEYHEIRRTGMIRRNLVFGEARY